MRMHTLLGLALLLAHAPRALAKEKATALPSNAISPQRYFSQGLIVGAFPRHIALADKMVVTPSMKRALTTGRADRAVSGQLVFSNGRDDERKIIRGLERAGLRAARTGLQFGTTWGTMSVSGSKSDLLAYLHSRTGRSSVMYAGTGSAASFTQKAARSIPTTHAYRNEAW